MGYDSRQLRPEVATRLVATREKPWLPTYGVLLGYFFTILAVAYFAADLVTSLS
jgi:hypothetical protein